MTQTLELRQMGVLPLTDSEMIDIDGHGFWYDASYVITTGVKYVWDHMRYVSALSRA